MDAREGHLQVADEDLEDLQSSAQSIQYQCPRCGRYIEESRILAHAKAEEYLIGLIKRDHPEWVEPDGTCSPCKTYYQALVERTGI